MTANFSESFLSGNVSFTAPCARADFAPLPFLDPFPLEVCE
jgi:hypothetical protein